MMELRLDRQRYIADHLRRGLCRSCNNPRVEGRRHCREHLEKIRRRVYAGRKRTALKLAYEVSIGGREWKWSGRTGAEGHSRI